MSSAQDSMNRRLKEQKDAGRRRAFAKEVEHAKAVAASVSPSTQEVRSAQAEASRAYAANTRQQTDLAPLHAWEKLYNMRSGGAQNDQTNWLNQQKHNLELFKSSKPGEDIFEKELPGIIKAGITYGGTDILKPDELGEIPFITDAKRAYEIGTGTYEVGTKKDQNLFDAFEGGDPQADPSRPTPASVTQALEAQGLSFQSGGEAQLVAIAGKDKGKQAAAGRLATTLAPLFQAGGPQAYDNMVRMNQWSLHKPIPSSQEILDRSLEDLAMFFPQFKQDKKTGVNPNRNPVVHETEKMDPKTKIPGVGDGFTSHTYLTNQQHLPGAEMNHSQGLHQNLHEQWLAQQPKAEPTQQEEAKPSRPLTSVDQISRYSSDLQTGKPWRMQGVVDQPAEPWRMQGIDAPATVQEAPSKAKRKGSAPDPSLYKAPSGDPITAQDMWDAVNRAPAPAEYGPKQAAEAQKVLNSIQAQYGMSPPDASQFYSHLVKTLKINPEEVTVANLPQLLARYRQQTRSGK